MKHYKYLLIFTITLISASAVAQVPFAFNYQGVARDTEGLAIGDQDISLLISIVSGSEDGFIEFTEQHNVRTSLNGLFSIRIGEGEYIDGNLRNIDWGVDVYFIRTEMDVTGGDDFIELGNSKLYSVPYALYALEAANATNSNQESSDDQELAINGLTLSIEDGNSVDLSGVRDGFIDADADPNNEIQSLGFSGTTLSLSSSNSVDLSSLIGGEEDADADPTNEIQTLSISGNQLSLSGANSVLLPSGGSTSTSPWQVVAPQIIHFEGTQASLGTDPTLPGLWLETDDDGSGVVDVINRNDASPIDGPTMHAGFGFYTFAKQSKLSNWLGIDDETGEGFINLYNDSKIKFNAESTDFGSGRVRTYGPNESLNWTISSLDGSPDHGFLAMRDSDGNTRLGAYVASGGSGQLFTDGPNGNLNNNLTFLGVNTNHGYMSVHDAQGNEEAGMYVNSTGQGIVFADIKNFRTPHPKLEDHDIVYASLEGPEAAAFLRGTGEMKKGIGSINFPEHFKHIISSQGMTIMITPLSAESKGIAVTAKNKDGFIVKELLSGQGSYQFDWEVKGIRAGFEEYEPVRKRDRSKSMTSQEDEEASNDPIRKKPIKTTNQ